MAQSERRVPTGLQFILLALAWGASFLFIKVGLEGLSAGQVVLGRLACGAVTLLLICLVTRQPLPRDRVLWGHLLIVGVLLCVAPFLLFSWAEGRIPSGLASIYNATTPLMTMAVSMLALPSEPRTRSRFVGLLLGFLGVLVILQPWHGLAQSGLGGQLACLGATLCYGLGFTYLRRVVSPRGLPAVPVATMQVGSAFVVMALLSPFLARGSVHLTLRVVGSVVLLGALGTGLAYVWNTNVVNDWGATTASMVTYLTPVVGVLLGILLLHERFSWAEPMGAALVILGIAASQGRLDGLLGGDARATGSADATRLLGSSVAVADRRSARRHLLQRPVESTPCRRPDRPDAVENFVRGGGRRERDGGSGKGTPVASIVILTRRVHASTLSRRWQR